MRQLLVASRRLAFHVRGGHLPEGPTCSLLDSGWGRLPSFFAWGFWGSFLSLLGGCAPSCPFPVLFSFCFCFFFSFAFPRGFSPQPPFPCPLALEVAVPGGQKARPAFQWRRGGATALPGSPDGSGYDSTAGRVDDEDHTVQRVLPPTCPGIIQSAWE